MIIQDIQTLKPFLVNLSTTLSLILIACWGLSLMAPYHWLGDLVSHFRLQYLIAACALLIATLFFREWPYAGFCAIVLAGSLYQFIPTINPALAPQTSSPTLTIVQFNRLYVNNRYTTLTDWLRENSPQFDVVSIQEITVGAAEKLQALRDIYPYHFPGQKIPGTDTYLMSKHPIVDSSSFWVGDADKQTLALKIRINVPGHKEPVTIYALHTNVPASARLLRTRNAQLRDIANVVSKDTSKNIILMGDWNITPYSPHFTNLVSQSGLKHNYDGLRAPGTWPSFFLLPFFKIPIDHILSSGNLALTNYARGPSMGSDHHSLIGKFVEANQP